MRRRHELTDDQWAKIEPLLPGREGDPGRTAADNRLFVNAVLFVARTGIPWRDLPERFGRWNSAWRRFDRWCATGVWPALADALGEPDLAELHLDSTTVRAQHSAAGSRRRPAEKKRTPTPAGASAAPAAGGRPRSTRPSTPPGGPSDWS
jgi:transposase